MKSFILITALIFCTLHMVYSSSWSMVSCKDSDMARQCLHYINKISKKEDTQFSVSGASRRHFSLDYRGNCTTFDDELVKLENCESCKTTFNTHENKTDCIEIEEPEPEPDN